jgi:hypothetical protein
MAGEIQGDQHPATIPTESLLKDCDEIRTRRSGPGGQHRNKVETAIVLTHRPTGITAEAGERRSQPENREVAVFRLRVNLALKTRLPRVNVSSENLDVSPLWQERSRNGRISVNPSHDDFPALLAESLDVIADHQWDVAESAGQLGVSSSQLVRFLKFEARALLLVNQQRQQNGMRPLR